MLRIRNEPSRGVYIGALYYSVVDYDLDGLIDEGSTTQIEAEDRRRETPIARVIEFSHAAPSVGNSSKESSKACTTRASRSR
jgi:hypothetical protein